MTQHTFDDLETTIGLMTRIGSCWSPSFSPDGTRLAFVSNLNGQAQVWTVSTAGGWPKLVTGLDDKVERVSWSPEGSWLAFSLAPGGGMNSQVYLVRPDGTDLHCLTAGGQELNWLGPWRRDGHALSIASNRGGLSTVSAYLMDVDSQTFDLIMGQEGVSVITDVSRDGAQAVIFHLKNRGDNDLYLMDLSRKDRRLLTPHEEPATFAGGFLSPDGRTIYLSSNRDGECSAFARVRLGPEGHPEPMEVLAAREDGELEVFMVSEDGSTAGLIWNCGGRSELSLIDLMPGGLAVSVELPVEVVHGISFSQDGSLLAVNGSGAATPMDIWVLERSGLAIAAMRQLTYSPHAGINLETLTRPSLVHFHAHDGLALSGWLYQPKGSASPEPIVLSFHGGPEDQERPSFNPLYQALLAHGIAVLAPNVRGSTGFGKTFAKLDDRERRVDAIRDVKACVDFAIEAGIADPKRIGIIGASYGGFLTLAGLTEYPEYFAAGADLFGIVNFETFFEHTEPWMAEISKAEYGDPAAQADLLRQLSPIHKIDRICAPTIVIHGSNDTNVPLIEAEQVVHSLQKRGIPVEYLLFPDEGHGLSKIPNRVRSAVAVTRWFAEHLGVGAS